MWLLRLAAYCRARSIPLMLSLRAARDYERSALLLVRVRSVNGVYEGAPVERDIRRGQLAQNVLKLLVP